jgi:hypothetical protein
MRDGRHLAWASTVTSHVELQNGVLQVQLHTRCKLVNDHVVIFCPESKRGPCSAHSYELQPLDAAAALVISRKYNLPRHVPITEPYLELGKKPDLVVGGIELTVGRTGIWAADFAARHTFLDKCLPMQIGQSMWSKLMAGGTQWEQVIG